jgi:hypothetical protein
MAEREAAVRAEAELAMIRARRSWWQRLPKIAKLAQGEGKQSNDKGRHSRAAKVAALRPPTWSSRGPECVGGHQLLIRLR